MAIVNKLVKENLDAIGANNDTLPTVLASAPAKSSIPSVLDSMMPKMKKKARKPLTEFDTPKE